MSGFGSDRPPISDMLLDRYRLAELDAEASAALEQRLEQEPQLRQRLSDLEQQSRQFAASPDIAGLAADALARAESQQRQGGLARLLRMRIVGGLLGATLVAVLALMVWPGKDMTPSSEDRVRIKGATLSLRLRVKRGDKQWTYKEGEWLRPGDRVRFVYDAQSAGYLYILGVEATTSKATFYEPHQGRAHRVRQGKRQVVAGAIELDATSGDELLLGLLCSKRVDPRLAARQAVAWVSRQVATSRPLSAPPEFSLPCAVSGVVIRKR